MPIEQRMANKTQERPAEVRLLPNPGVEAGRAGPGRVRTRCTHIQRVAGLSDSIKTCDTGTDNMDTVTFIESFWKQTI